jgi:cytochrome c
LKNSRTNSRIFVTLTLLAGCCLFTGCMNTVATETYQGAMHRNPHKGKELIESYGCGACHIIPGIYTARGLVGPPLFYFGRRTIIAGELPNTPDNLVRWIRNPQSIEPGTAMPNLGVTEDQGKDMAAYLYTLQ